jgi:hypothetical protein
LALRLIWITGKKAGVVLIAAAMTLITLRRSITLSESILHGYPLNLITEC